MYFSDEKESWGKWEACVWSEQVKKLKSVGLTMFVVSDPNNLSSFFHAMQDCIFCFESLFSKGTPGFMSEALIQSDP
jgi:hypothetical protein